METSKKYERCVGCGAKTKVPINRHIDLREYYIVGVGQLCSKCGKTLCK